MRTTSDFSLVFCLVLSLTAAAYTTATDEGMTALAGLMDLQTLDLGGTDVTDAGLVEFTNLTSLKSLDLLKTRVTEVGVIGVSFEHTGITNEGLQELKTLDPLQSLKNPSERRG